MNKYIKRSSLLITATIFSISFLLAGFPAKTEAAYEGGWLIDDAIFLDSRSMTSSQIQSFLSSKGSGLASKSFKLQCYGSSSQERQWCTAAGAPCDQTISAARIIYYASQIYGINPRVVLATLQKEQSLITTQNPTSWQLNQAMGYACPTSGNCSGSSTFSYQIDSGVWALRYHYERANRNYNWWSPSYNNYWVCGSSKHLYKPSLYPGQRVAFYDTNGTHYRTHYIKNPATSAMYCYTPHAYNNPNGLYGKPAFGFTGLYYSGSYNFVTAFEAWFGSTQIPWRSLDVPRWMETKVDTHKKNPLSGQNAESVIIPAGTQIYFESKLTINGKLYLRSKYSHNKGEAKAFLFSDLQEIDLSYSPMDVPRWMEIDGSNVRKTDPIRDKSIFSVIPDGYKAYFDEKITIGGKLYLRTKTDKLLNRDRVISFTSLQDTTVTYENFDKPRWMELSSDSREYNIKERSYTGSILSSGEQLFLDKKMIINGEEFYRNGIPTDSSYHAGIPAKNLKEIDPSYISLERPRAFRLKEDMYKKDPVTGVNTGPLLEAGRIIYFPTKTTIGDTLYFRSLYDTQRNHSSAINSSQLEEVSVEFVSLDRPRAFRLKEDMYKKDPVTGQNIEVLIKAGRIIYFPTKTTIGDTLYFRSLYDTQRNQIKVMPSTAFEEIPVKFNTMIEPRALRLNKTTHKKDPVTLQNIGSPFAAGTVLSFDDRISINGELYLRTASDTASNQLLVIPFSHLSEI